MTLYQAYLGWSTGTLVTLVPQPRSPGLQSLITNPAGGGAYDDGFPFTEWRYTSLDREEFAAINAILGLTSARSAKITAKTRVQADDTDSSDFVIVRAWIEKPQPNYDLGWHRDFVYKLTYIRIVS